MSLRHRMQYRDVGRDRKNTIIHSWHILAAENQQVIINDVIDAKTGVQGV